MSEDLLAGLVFGATVAVITVLALLKVAELVRKVKRTARRWGRTRLVFSQTSRRRRRS
ncbi:hypothetical protein [Nocardiopsis sp. CNT312]|uniref:hypothetical protein n=1 Tax=Nocardiopsis sp. CNT312 TaxID=1137268 RepID=UPI0004AD26E5|nr:hypothetical protein [Nocardiopsis sp. CNT312]